MEQQLSRSLDVRRAMPLLKNIIFFSFSRILAARK